MVLLWSTKVFLPSSKHCYIKRIVPGTQKNTCIEVWNSISLCLLFGLIITTSVQHFDVNLASTWRLSSTNVLTLVTSFETRDIVLFAMQHANQYLHLHLITEDILGLSFTKELASKL